MKSENYKQLLTSEFVNPEMTTEEFTNTLEHFAELHHKEQSSGVNNPDTTNYKERYKAMKKAMQWTNQDVADFMGSKLNSVEVSTSKPDKEFPRWGKLAIEVYEQMIERAKVTFDKE